MEISRQEIDELIQEYQPYVDKIIRYNYGSLRADFKEDLRQVGMIGLWKGIQAYFAKNLSGFDQKFFLNVICLKIRCEMKEYLKSCDLIKIGVNQWRIYRKIQKIKETYKDVSDAELADLVNKVGLNITEYQKINRLRNYLSLDYSSEDEPDFYKFFSIEEDSISKIFERSYLKYIITSALAAITSERQHKIIRTWIWHVLRGEDLKKQELAELCGVKANTVSLTINRFIDICRFVRDCESIFCRGIDNVLYFPEVPGKERASKVRGVQWSENSRKWVAIIGQKKKVIYLGSFDRKEDAIRARRDAEIAYRGHSEIRI